MHDLSRTGESCTVEIPGQSCASWALGHLFSFPGPFHGSSPRSRDSDRILANHPPVLPIDFPAAKRSGYSYGGGASPPRVHFFGIRRFLSVLRAQSGWPILRAVSHGPASVLYSLVSRPTRVDKGPSVSRQLLPQKDALASNKSSLVLFFFCPGVPPCFPYSYCSRCRARSR